MNRQTDKSPEFIQEKYIQLLESANVELHQKSKVFTLKNILVYSSIVGLLFVLISIFVLEQKSQNIFNNHLIKTSFDANILLVQDADNNYYKIPENKTIQWVTNNGLFVKINAKQIHFTATQKLKNPDYYTIYVPQNKQYQIFLADNTKIKLNENTKIKFTNTRNIKKNNVTLRGEAYFEVAHQTGYPFKVQASRMNIRVLGTEFNVQNYTKNHSAQVALVNGSVRVGTPKQHQLIVPGQQASIQNQSDIIKVQQADFNQILSWTRQQLIFSDKKLSEIVKQVGKWYKVTFDILDENIRNIHFTGNIQKQDGLLHFLQILQYTEGIDYKINNDTISLTKNKHH